MYNISDIFICDKDYINKVKYADDNNLAIESTNTEDADGNKQFKFIKIEDILETEEERIIKLQNTLTEYKRDIEQALLFNMDRPDLEFKRSKCSEIVLELRRLKNKT